MDEKERDELLARYFAGECSEEEEERVHDWIADKPGVAERMARLQRIWDATDAPSSSWDAEAAWEDLHQRIQRGVTSSPKSDHPRRERSRERSHRTARRPSRSGGLYLARTVALALSVLAIALVAALATDSISFWPVESDAKVFFANKGEQSTVRLPDGTKAQLNADSRLTIPTEFGDQREVRLKGEAYFKVREDSTRAFVVHTQDASIKVLGTAFNVRSYQKTEVAVKEGKVALYGEQLSDGEPTAVLRPSTLATVSNEGLGNVQRGVDLSKELAWTENKLIFEDAPFDEVVRKLERWYDTQVEVELPIDKLVKLNATFNNLPLEDVLHDISAALNIKYHRDGDHVTFYR